MPAAITMTGVSKTFREGAHHVLALNDVSLTINRGEFFLILGPSGCGKSTLLRILCGLETPSAGTVKFNKDISRADIGFVFQHFALLPWLTVGENIEMGLVGRGVGQSDREEIIQKELTQFGLQGFEHSYPRELSGGMRQRVGIARAFATSPVVLFMDEPFSELDSFIAEELRQDLLQLWKERGTTIVMVTHLIREAIQLGDRIAVMTGRPGQIESLVKNTMSRPRNLRSQASFALEDKLDALVKTTVHARHALLASKKSRAK